MLQPEAEQYLEALVADADFNERWTASYPETCRGIMTLDGNIARDKDGNVVAEFKDPMIAEWFVHHWRISY